MTRSDSSRALAVALLLFGLVAWAIGRIRRADRYDDEHGVEIEIEEPA